jgi:transposase
VLDVPPLELVEVHRAEGAGGLASGEEVGDDHQDGVAEGDEGALLPAARDAETRTRFPMVLLAGEGRPAAAVAALVRRSPDTVWRVVRRYQRGGPDGVPRRPRPGHRDRSPVAWGQERRRVIDRDPHAVGVDSANWTTGLLAAYLARATGHRVHLETVRRHLHQAGYVCKRPGWTLKRKAEEDSGWAGTG